MINLIHGNCMDLMKDKSDDYYDLAIVDVNYGIKQDGRNNHTRGNKAKPTDYRDSYKYDDNPPNPQYFDVLKMKSKNQIIWGANHFIDNMPFNINSPCWVVWDKMNGGSDFADCELAWTSFKTAVRIYQFRWQGMLQGDMKNKQKYIHPNMKPIQLYKWLLKNYAKLGDKILDSHGGSFSHAIAVHEMNEFHQMDLSLDIIEIDKDYFEAGKKRFENHIKQLTIFSK